MRIGEVARRSGVSVRALRYYEEQRLLVADRTPSGQRTFPETAIERVLLIQSFYAAGLPSRTIERILPCVDAGTAAPDTIDLLTTERERLVAMMSEITHALGRLDEVIEHAQNPDPEHCTAQGVAGATVPIRGALQGVD